MCLSDTLELMPFSLFARVDFCDALKEVEAKTNAQIQIYIQYYITAGWYVKYQNCWYGVKSLSQKNYLVILALLMFYVKKTKFNHCSLTIIVIFRLTLYFQQSHVQLAKSRVEMSIQSSLRLDLEFQITEKYDNKWRRMLVFRHNNSYIFLKLARKQKIFLLALWILPLKVIKYQLLPRHSVQLQHDSAKINWVGEIFLGSWHFFKLDYLKHFL